MDIKTRERIALDALVNAARYAAFCEAISIVIQHSPDFFTRLFPAQNAAIEALQKRAQEVKEILDALDEMRLGGGA